MGLQELYDMLVGVTKHQPDISVCASVYVQTLGNA